MPSTVQRLRQRFAAFRGLQTSLHGQTPLRADADAFVNGKSTVSSSSNFRNVAKIQCSGSQQDSEQQQQQQSEGSETQGQNKMYIE
jgi:hypothetical protein